MNAATQIHRLAREYHACIAREWHVAAAAIERELARFGITRDESGDWQFDERMLERL